MVEVCKKEGAGFVAYNWARPGATKPQPKVSYVRIYQKWDWIVGSGAYVDDIEAVVASARNRILSLYLGVGLFVLLGGIWGGRMIGKELLGLKDAAARLAIGDLGAEITLNRTDEVGHLAASFRSMAEASRQQAAAIQRLAAGDLSVDVAARSAQDQVSVALQTAVTSLRGLVAEVNDLTQGAAAGKLAVRGRADRFQGGYRQIVEGVNDTLDAVIGPLNVAAEYVNRIGKGDIPPSITEVYQGDFNEIKNNLNACIDGLGGLVEANAVLQRMAANDLTGGVTGAYQGVFAEVGRAVNETRDRIHHIQDTAVNISRGDLTDLAKSKAIGNGTGRRSENDQLVPAFIGMMEAIQALVVDTDGLTKAAVAGKLATRADGAKHHGDYRKVIEGVNDTLDAVIAPLNVAAEYVDRIGKGDIPSRVTESWQGDFNELKNNLNACIDGLGGLVEANAVLQRMAMNDLTAGVTGAYQGVFAEVGRAVNETRDRLRQIQDTAVNLSRGDLTDLSKYKAIGNGTGRRSENDQLIPAFIGMMEAIQALVADTDALTKAAVAGKLAVRADAAKHQGDFRKVVEGVNADARRGDRAAQTCGRVCGPDQQGRHPAEDHGDLTGRLQRDEEQPEHLHRRGERAGRRRGHAGAGARWTASWRPGPTPRGTRATSGRSSRASTGRSTRWSSRLSESATRAGQGRRAGPAGRR